MFKNLKEILLSNIKEKNIIEEITYLCKHSLFLKNYILKFPESILNVKQLLGKPRDKQAILADISKFDFLNFTPQQFCTFLRHKKMEEYIIITYNDLIKNFDVSETTFHLSSFASAVLEVTYKYAYNQLKKDFGIPRDHNGDEVPFTIIGLGKLGGEELNFSSDIDIMYVYGTEKGITDGYKKISNHEFFVKLGEKIFHYLSDRDDIGIVFRVDLRLRPDGEKGALALPLRSYEIYYETYGQSWERMMLLKANPVAGNIDLGHQFLETVRPFVFRRTLDTKLINDLIEIKGKIQHRVDLKSKNEKNVKLGFGGIREIEFIVQTLQILNYPKHPEIFHRNTLKGLKKLADKKLLDEKDAEILTEAYKFLRKLEHMAQVENELQTHTIPENSATFHLYLERCGFKTKEEFEEKYNKITSSVNEIFSKLLENKNYDETSVLFDEELDTEDITLFLKSKNIKNPEKCAKIIKQIIRGNKYTPRQKDEKKLLKLFFKTIIPNLYQYENPDEILSFYEKLFLRRSNLYLIYDLSLESPHFLQKLTNLFAMSKHLSEIVLNNPNTLEFLYDPISPDYTVEKILSLLKDTISKKNIDEELEYELLRLKQKEFIFNIGYLYLNKSINIVQTMYSLTNIARAFTILAFERSFDKLKEKYGTPITVDKNVSDYLVVGLGKLGSFEISFGSDLDLIILYEDNGFTDGLKKITNREFFSKLVQKAIHYLSTMTYNGFLYKVDMRLRPSGSSGTLVTTIKSFDEYHKKESMTWEKQALLRADVINEQSSLTQTFFKIKNRILFTKEITREQLQEIYNMRIRIEKDKGSPPSKNDFKAGYGGLIDIEFIAQSFQLRYGYTSELLKGTNTHYILHFLRDLGLITNRNFYALHNSYLFLRHIENLTRVYQNLSTSKLPNDDNLLAQIGHFFGYKKNAHEKIVSDFQNVRNTVRGAFNRLFAELLKE
ncbi:bifunctional [glutamate--ammonia ligase]-adenylyl-L-tyrosine phosphorylase/[glutamate--ammonia-ligase] adenylyltransferase [Deferribacter autotrophicus]|uniref:Bifunctional [glutamate--ammonia ligase]-adenylyl-L-tyrosine phosphorylase/[glutamate--ammonia-ligase] adenylyltransferase n=1 Tax=Deferribacter autotrophicus TaxID=500465 RepID=A0A5A8F686_9BACT|nr:bifunctional [glutamate--ammonia ligase]-adenylyl-L-tyrosine phosphorylase/[glutamate--ammonia-ligase] adenylyltransferase [Deferribacter autotrophicus]KAA0259065.1 bifunctional [glutamate--ammonia ligase]-adenylyl-L-tyrosine phosphorylase/[glutamate--ammonia-ligase] adenylyltransferase [Deferribacter autotrophicus]